MAKKKLSMLFVCVHNSARSQMAEAFANQLGRGRLRAYSAGSEPSGEVHPFAVQAMKEAGIDISSFRSKGFQDLPVKKFDYVVTMGCKDACPFVPAREHLDWALSDPHDQDLEFFRNIRDIIKINVRNFLAKIPH